MAKPRSKDHTAVNLDQLEQEKRRLYQSKNDPKRLEEVKGLLDFVHWGITPKENKTK